MSLFISILVFILILAVLVIVHEFGHFIVAKKSGIRVDEFGFGFPPRIAKLFRWRGTLFSLNLIPFGGFVKIFGENGDDGTPTKDSFVAKSKWTQAAVLFAGPLFNFLLAFILFFALFLFGTPSVYNERYADHMKDLHVAVIEVAPDSPAEEVGILVGDQIISVTYGTETILVEDSTSITDLLKIHETKEMKLSILRDGEEQVLVVRPEFGLYEDQTYPVLGVYLDTIGTLSLPIHKAFWQGLVRTGEISVATIAFLVDMIGGLITGDSSLAGAVTGPVGIVPAVGNALQVGFSFVVVMTALISINLAVINLLPFPALDGGRLLFIGIEAIKGSPISPKIVSWVNGIGFLVLVGLMLLVTVRDILNLAH